MSSGKKYDGDKAPLVRGCFRYFPDALEAVAFISRYGCQKYDLKFEDKNFKLVDNPIPRYEDADGRHLLREGWDDESNMLHAAHHAWDALAALQLALEAGTPLYRPKGESK
jgi:hypothetical protein